MSDIERLEQRIANLEQRIYDLTDWRLMDRQAIDRIDEHLWKALRLRDKHVDYLGDTIQKVLEEINSTKSTKTPDDK